MTGFSTGASKLFSRHSPGGVFVIQDIKEVPGNIFFVDSTNGTDAAGRGLSPDAPLATLDYAVGLCTANQGDVILLAPGHAETLTASVTCTIDVAGVTIIGLGVGSLQPTFTLGTDATATISVTAANCRIENIKVISDVADQAVGITVAAGGDGFTMRRCYLTDGAAAKELVIGVSLAAGCDRALIEDCEFYTTPAGGCASAIKMVGASDRTVIRNNIMLGDYSVACIDGATAAGTLITIDGNLMQNIDATAGLTVDLHASTTGAVTRNMSHGGKNNTRPLVSAGCFNAGNLSTTALTEGGGIDPAVETFA